MADERYGIADKRDLGAFIPAVLDDAGLDPLSFRVYCRIARRVSCYESIPNMAVGCAMSERSVRRALAKLVDLGLVEREDRPGRSSMLRLLPLTPATQAGVEPTPATQGGDPGHTGGGTPATQADKGTPLKGIQEGLEPATPDEFKTNGNRRPPSYCPPDVRAKAVKDLGLRD